MTTSKSIGPGKTLLKGWLIGALLTTGLATAALNLQATVTFTTLHTFDRADGSGPAAALVQGTDGYLYSTTGSGGDNNRGTVFKISTNGMLTTLHSFDATDGSFAQSALVLASDGYFYSTTYDGGTNYAGTFFKITGSGAFTSLCDFPGPAEAALPTGVVQGRDGYFYGTTVEGTYGGGNIFRISSDGTFSNLYAFTGGDDGEGSYGGLVQGTDGYFYGMTYAGGTNQYGTVFRISSSGAFTSLYSFTGGDDGAAPQDWLVQGSDGCFYGTTQGGGTHRAGTVFKISSTGALTTLYSFTGSNDGGGPYAGLVQGSDGDFYGTTLGGGTNGGGTVFKLNSTGALTTLYSFAGGGDLPGLYGALIQGSDGSFYGTTLAGGTNGVGTVFRLSVGLHGSGAPRVQFSANATNGVAPLIAQFISPGADSGGNSIVSWNWNFGDGGCSALQNPCHTYTNVGFYLPTLFVTNTNATGIAAIGPQITVNLISILINVDFGRSNGLFGFDLSGPAGSNVVIQASCDLQNWTPLQTNVFGSGLLYFSDPQPPTNNERFYRAVLP